MTTAERDQWRATAEMYHADRLRFQAALDEANADRQRLRGQIAEYEHNISWHTTCSGCANLLDQCYAETIRAETAEAQVLRLQAQIAMDHCPTCFGPCGGCDEDSDGSEHKPVSS
jgi:hypothetical protein